MTDCGQVTEVDWGGMRRIDKLLYRPQLARLRGVATVSALAGLTDHVPVVITVGS